MGLPAPIWISDCRYCNRSGFVHLWQKLKISLCVCFFFCVGCAGWHSGCSSLVWWHLYVEKPHHNSAGPPPSLGSCVVPGAFAPYSVPLHVPGWGLEVPVPSSNPTIHGCQALTGGAYWWPRWIGGRVQCSSRKQGSRGFISELAFLKISRIYTIDIKH